MKITLCEMYYTKKGTSQDIEVSHIFYGQGQKFLKTISNSEYNDNGKNSKKKPLVVDKVISVETHK